MSGKEPVNTSIDAIDAFLRRTAGERLDEFQEFLRIPTIAVMSEHARDVRDGAEWIAARMRYWEALARS